MGLIDDMIFFVEYFKNIRLNKFHG